MVRSMWWVPLMSLCGGIGLGCGEALSELQIQPNPACDISCIVSWSTAQPGTSAVEFRDDDGHGWIVEDDGQTTDHEVIVVGMHADERYTLQAVSVLEDGGELRAEAQVFETGSLPEAWYAGEVDVFDEAQVAPGWTLANLASGIFSPTIVVMVDLEGEPVWYMQYGEDDGRADIQASFVDGEHVLIGPGVAGGMPIVEVDLAGRVVWEGPSQPVLDDDNLQDLLADGVMHHALYKLPDGGYLTPVFEFQQDVIGDEIWQLDADGQPVWTWNTFDHLEIDLDKIGLLAEWTHANSMALDEDADALYVNSWNLDQVWKIDRASGDVVWTLGPGGDFAPDADAAYPWFEGAHSVELLGPGQLLLYDNGAHGRSFSRLIELHLDEAAMTSEIVWEYPGELAVDDWYNYSWGDVDVLPDGHLLMNAGNGAQGYSPTRIVELTRDGEIVWQMWWPDGDQHDARGSFQAERMPALARPL